MKRFHFLIPFLSIAAVATFVIGTGCGGGNNNNNNNPPVVDNPPPQPDVPVDHLAMAKLAFKEKVWPTFSNIRCVNCHDFVNRVNLGTATTGSFFAGHTNDPVPVMDNCNSCHKTVSGVPDWKAAPSAPVDMRWKIDEPDPNRVRELVITNKGTNLFKHIFGQGANHDALVQWCFSDAPDAPPVKPGGVPGGGPHNGQIPPTELMNFAAFKPLYVEWICLESKAGNVLFNPGEVDCSAFP